MVVPLPDMVPTVHVVWPVTVTVPAPPSVPLDSVKSASEELLATDNEPPEMSIGALLVLLLTESVPVL